MLFAMNLNSGLKVEIFLQSANVIWDMMPQSHPNLSHITVDVLKLNKVAVLEINTPPGINTTKSSMVSTLIMKKSIILTSSSHVCFGSSTHKNLNPYNLSMWKSNKAYGGGTLMCCNSMLIAIKNHLKFFKSYNTI